MCVCVCVCVCVFLKKTENSETFIKICTSSTKNGAGLQYPHASRNASYGLIANSEKLHVKLSLHMYKCKTLLTLDLITNSVFPFRTHNPLEFKTPFDFGSQVKHRT